MTTTNFTGDETTAQLHDGAQAVRRMLVEVQQSVFGKTATTSDFDVRDIAALLESVLHGGSPGERKGVMLALADFVGSALEGCAPDLDGWNPLERLAA